jgi:hypothetical protein
MTTRLTPEEQMIFLRAVENDLGYPASPEGLPYADDWVDIPSERISDAAWFAAETYSNGDTYAVLTLTITAPSGTRWVVDLPVRASYASREEEIPVSLTAIETD